MRKIHSLLLISPCILSAFGQSGTGVPTKAVITVGHLFTQNTPVLTANDLTVTQHMESVPITKLIPLQGDQGGLELFILVDNCSNCEPDSKFKELSKFMLAMSPATALGVASIQDGRLQIIQKPTIDHDAAVKALAVPVASQPSDPFGPLAELMKGWKEGSARRAIVMISNGISPAANLDMPDPLAEDAIATAQRQRITLYAIYHPSSDYLSTDFRKLIWGQDQLAHVALETGGEAYFLTSGPLPSMAPYLADISTHLANQYLLEFLARPNETTGVLSDFQVSAKDKRIELMVPYKAWIPNAAGNGVKSRTSVQ